MASINKQKWDSNFNMAPLAIHNELQGIMNLKNKKIVDFGCGLGVKTLGVAHHYLPEKIVGVDISDALFKDIGGNAAACGYHEALPSSLSFAKITPGKPIDVGFRPDCIFSWSVFEHVRLDIMPLIFRDHFELLEDNGVIFLQINPLFFSPFGNHLNSWIDEPWAHLRYQTNVFQEMLYSNNQNIDVAGIKVHDDDGGEKTYKEKPGPWNCFRTLNRVTVPQLKKIAENAGFKIIKETISRTSLRPDEDLLAVYHEDILLTEGVRLVMQKCN
jgi:trans-aconitate methyltransferase